MEIKRIIIQTTPECYNQLLKYIQEEPDLLPGTYSAAQTQTG